MNNFIPVTLEEIEKVWGRANFGDYLNNRKIDVIKYSLLKWASGYSTGSTAFCILYDLKLIAMNKTLTRRGKFQLWEFFKEKRISV